MKTQASSPIKSYELQVVIIRKDGTREDLGTIAYWHRNPLRRAWHRLAQIFKRS